MSQGWLYAILDHMRGGELYSVPVTGIPDNGNLQKALLSVKKNEALLIVSNWNADREKHASNDLTLFIPESVMAAKPSSIRQISFTEENSVYDMIRRDYKASGLLSKKHLEHRGEPATLAFSSAYDVMASDRREGQSFILDHWGKYEKLMRDSLTLKDFSGMTEKQAGGLSVAFKATPR